jgi:hypothetical protein
MAAFIDTLLGVLGKTQRLTGDLRARLVSARTPEDVVGVLNRLRESNIDRYSEVESSIANDEKLLDIYQREWEQAAGVLKQARAKRLLPQLARLQKYLALVDLSMANVTMIDNLSFKVKEMIALREGLPDDDIDLVGDAYGDLKDAVAAATKAMQEVEKVRVVVNSGDEVLGVEEMLAKLGRKTVPAEPAESHREESQVPRRESKEEE